MERTLRRIYKNNAGFGDESARAERTRRLTLHKQKEDRNREFLQRRNVVIDPTPPKPIVKAPTRREKLLKWKAQKEVLLQTEKAKKKPPFRVGVLQHKQCPLQDLVNLPPPKSTVKKTTAKKASWQQAEHILKPTAASKALAALSGPAKNTPVNSAFKRVTRSQTQRMAPEQAAGKSALSGAKQKVVQNLSFAPKNHVFRAPINLTFPVTPDALKRNPGKKVGVKKAVTPNWLGVSGVSLLKEIDPLPSIDEKKGENINPRLKSEKTLEKMDLSPSDIDAQKDDIREKSAEVKPVESKLPVPEKKMTPQKRRSVRLATPNPKEAEKVKGDKNQEAQKRRSVRLVTPNPKEAEKVEEDENHAVVAKVSRLSIHSPTRMDALIPSPEERGDSFPAQFSPFIVTARGADRHKQRRSRLAALKTETTEEEKRAEQVGNFRSLLETETNRLLALCDEWEGIEKGSGASLPSAAQDLILGAVGQTRLLTKDKFQQFKRLVDTFEEGSSSEGKMTADDLTGFWEMINVTVTGLDKRFKQLSNLQKNNWVEEVKVAPKKLAKPKTVKPEIAQQSRSRIRDAIAAARKMQQESKLKSSKNETLKSFDGGFFKIDSPKKAATSESGVCKNSPKTPNPPNLQPRRSLLQQVLTNSATNSANRAKSPSISEVSTRIRASLLGRRVSMSRPEEEQILRPIPASTATPGKGILKMSFASSRKSKVAFLQNSSPDSEQKENSTEADIDEPTRNSLRRSLRFSVGTKFASSPVSFDSKPSLLPMRVSNGIPTRPLENGDLISWGSP